MWHCKYTTSVDIHKARYKKLVIHVQSHRRGPHRSMITQSAVSLLDSEDQRYIKRSTTTNQSYSKLILLFYTISKHKSLNHK